MARPIFRVTETDVDGCGGTAEEFVYFDRHPSEAELAAFRSALASAKRAASETCSDTAAMVEAALRDPAVRHLNGELGGSPFAGSVEF